MSAVSHASDLHAEAVSSNERRALVLSGERSAAYGLADRILADIPVGIRDTLAISAREAWTCSRVEPDRSSEVMGRTLEVIVLDLFEMTSPNAIGRATGAVDGGGLLLVLCPSLDRWAHERDAFDRRLVVTPFELSDVSGHFRTHLIETLRTHEGIAIVDADDERLVRPGLTGAPPFEHSSAATTPTGTHRFPGTSYRQCATADQRRVLQAFESLHEPEAVVVVTAERGRGKTAAVGLAAVSFAAEGLKVGITAPGVENVRTAFAHGGPLADAIGGETSESDGDQHPRIQMSEGSVTFVPLDAVDHGDDFDILFVDEAAGVPVPRLEALLDHDRLALTTTRHGYEGTGQGFATRFRQRLETSRHRIVEREMQTPIRFSPDDPLDPWLNRALFLDARPATADAVDVADPDGLRYRRWDSANLLDERETFKQVMGLLARAHYRTEPDDVARILDAPNLELVTLEDDGVIVSVALLAREGAIPGEERERAYRGERLRGNMLPDIFINGFRATAPAGEPGLRIVRLATHPAARREGCASALLDEIHRDVGEDMAWTGTGFGVTPGLVEFWSANDFVPIFLGTTRNRASGVHSIVMLHTGSGSIVDRFGRGLPGRLRGSLLDAHRDVDPESVLAVLEAISDPPELSLSDEKWRMLVAAGHGPGRFDLDPEPARQLAMYHLIGDTDRVGDDRDASLLVMKVLQGRPWETVAEALDFPSVGEARRALGEIIAELVDRHGGDVVAEERRRLAGGEGDGDV